MFENLSYDFGILIAVTVGLVEVYKRVTPEKLHRFSPLVSLTLGIGICLLVDGVNPKGLIKGIVLGLSAVGLYSGAKNTIQKSK